MSSSNYLQLLQMMELLRMNLKQQNKRRNKQRRLVIKKRRDFKIKLCDDLKKMNLYYRQQLLDSYRLSIGPLLNGPRIRILWMKQRSSDWCLEIVNIQLIKEDWIENGSFHG